MSDLTFFGLQIVLRAARGSPVRTELRGLVVDPSTDVGAMEKESLCRRIASCLEDAEGLFERGYWDFIAEPYGAKREFDEWCADIESNAGDPGDPQLGAGDSPYFIVTLAFLLTADGPSAESTGERCDVSEDAYWTRDTFRSLIAAVRDLGFSSVRADAVYLKAGAIDPETSREEIDGDGFEYLHRLT